MTIPMTTKKRTRFFFGCEGKSEKTYGQFIQKIALCNKLHITFQLCDCKGGSPLDVANKAIEDSIKQNREAYPIKAKFLFVDCDKLDEMKTNETRELKKLLENENFITIWQKWDHEGFLLRHFRGHENDFPPKSESLSALKRVWPSYQKGKMTLRDYDKKIGNVPVDVEIQKGR